MVSICKNIPLAFFIVLLLAPFYACSPSEQHSNNSSDQLHNKLLGIFKDRFKTNDVNIRVEMDAISGKDKKIAVTVKNSPLLNNDSCIYFNYISSHVILITDSIYKLHSEITLPVSVIVDNDNSIVRGESEYSQEEITRAVQSKKRAVEFIDNIQKNNFTKMGQLVSFTSFGLDSMEASKEFLKLNTVFSSRNYSVRGFLITDDYVIVLVHFYGTPQCEMWRFNFLKSDNDKLSGIEQM